MIIPEWNEAAAKEILQVARTYYDNREKLIYSYGGKTFLGGAPLWDPDYGRRGNIDCSTYIQLVLQGIRYVDSPFMTGERCLRADDRYSWIQKPLLRRLEENPRENRRACALAEYYVSQGLCFQDTDAARPGDLVFYKANAEDEPHYLRHGAFLAICHVGIVAEDRRFMYNSTGDVDKGRQEERGMEAIQITPLVADRAPLLFARPRY